MQIGTNYCYHLLLATLRYNRKKVRVRFQLHMLRFQSIFRPILRTCFWTIFGGLMNFNIITTNRVVDIHVTDFWTNLGPILSKNFFKHEQNISHH